jgi:hypothetical protein
MAATGDRSAATRGDDIEGVANHEGRPSCPRSVPVENVQATRSRLALPLVIWSRGLNRVFA